MSKNRYGDFGANGLIHPLWDFGRGKYRKMDGDIKIPKEFIRTHLGFWEGGSVKNRWLFSGKGLMDS